MYEGFEEPFGGTNIGVIRWGVLVMWVEVVIIGDKPEHGRVAVGGGVKGDAGCTIKVCVETSIRSLIDVDGIISLGESTKISIRSGSIDWQPNILANWTFSQSNDEIFCKTKK